MFGRADVWKASERMGLNSVVVSRRSLAFAIPSLLAFTSFRAVFARKSRSYEPPDSTADLSGKFETDGSSTLGPLTEAAIEDFFRIVPKIRITNGVSGTGGGFERFAKGETTIANASRQITLAEDEHCAANGIEWYQFVMAYDGIVVAVSSDNDLVESLTVDELRNIWSANGGVSLWADTTLHFLPNLSSSMARERLQERSTTSTRRSLAKAWTFVLNTLRARTITSWFRG